MSFNIALSGLNAASADLDVTSNNIANTGTVGFKESRAEFADIFATSQLGLSQNAIGQGARLSNVRQQFNQGQFDFTGNSLDLAVSGTGFFRLSQEGSISYSRNGAFELNRDGFIVNADGKQLTGFTANTDGNLTGALGPLQVNTGDVQPSATDNMELNANLDATQEPPALAFDEENPETYNFSTSTTIFDSLGRSHLSTLYFVKGAADNEWQVYTDVNGNISAPTDVVFNPDGSLSTVNGAADPNVDFTFAAADTAGVEGANDLDITVDFGGLTQFGTPFNVAELRQNGFTAGQFSSLDVESDGTIFGRYTNGQSLVLGQLALARFPSPEKLTQTGDTAWVESFESGAPVLGNPTQSGLGSIQAGALEQSNVNITEQLVKMITAQRNFQANAKMISTQDQVTQEIINIR
ncbi:flagellar hook protein FlgE [Natronocella acetinitrilica]|uniref:Flagellar hook protein FlgE n=1 Tax=Natronocella acetinitrilica TaxID=414046 RepID=A0AAE3KCD0_9GAMM|nr:flagellar hook protein FlgE [Natronocella acetinitrilica]MCP1675621.1 flagellar hook protein FlgE [Natronocella acetinitrilica]